MFDEQRQMDRELLFDPSSGENSFGQKVRFRAREQTMRNFNATLATAHC